MRKQLAIGLSLFALTGLGGVNKNFVSVHSQEAHQQYTHLVETSQSQTFEPFVRASLFADLPNRVSFQTANVSFIAGDGGLTFETSQPVFTDESPQTCKNLGYSLTSCSSGNPTSPCPYNSTYFKECCDARYKYSKSECSYPNTVSGDSCGGKYMCYCDKSLYSVTSCPSPQVTSGGSCTEEGKTYYGKCVCPSNYNQTCDGLNQQGVGTGCTQNGVTYYTSCQCKSGYNMTCSDLGPVTPTDYCLKDGIKYYNNCKTCENKCTLDVCPSGVTCTLEECSQKYCATGCAVGAVDLDNYWCDGALRCWFQ